MMFRDTTIFLVVPEYTISVSDGGGQRTRLFLDAARDVAPVEVIVVGKWMKEWHRDLFPGAQRVHLVWTDAMLSVHGNVFSRAVKNLGRLIDVTRAFQVHPNFSKKVEELIDGRPAVVVFRFTRTFARSGIVTDLSKQRAVLVDIDDRIEQVYEAKLAHKLGDGLLMNVARKIILHPLNKFLSKQLAKASYHWVCGEEDKLAYEGIEPVIARNVAFVSSAPDNAKFAPPSRSQNVIFVGIGTHAPNPAGVEWFLKNCWADIRKECPGARFKLIGGGPWREKLGELLDLDGVDTLGFVEDLVPEYENARVAICPLFTGGGSKIKVVEACAYARPVVLASHSTRALGAHLVDALSVADDPKDFAEACLAFLNNSEFADETGNRLQMLQQKYASRESVQHQITETIREFAAI